MCFDQYNGTSIWNFKSEENYDENAAVLPYQGTALGFFAVGQFSVKKKKT